jgi:hypothetical protein
MAKRRSKVKKNWLNAAHFHCCLSWTTFDDRGKLEGECAGDVARGVWDVEATVRVEVRRGIERSVVRALEDLGY